MASSKKMIGTIGLVSSAVLIACAGSAIAQTACRSSPGPDVIVGDITGPQNYAVDILKGFDSFSLGTTSCNQGLVNLNWYTSSNTTNPALFNDHPVIGGGIFKMKNGRFEQLGFSWLKHGFYALSQPLCCSPCNSTNGATLGVGCSDPYTASRNGTQGNLGPRWQVNPSTGDFPYPPANPAFSGSAARRVQIALTALEPSSATVRYFSEAQYVSPDDALANNKNNNSSYRQLSMADSGGATNRFNAAFIGSTAREKPAIQAWKDFDATVQLVSVDVPTAGTVVDGRFWVGSKVTDLGDGTWQYEYAIHNLNSDRAGGSFSVPLSPGVLVTDIGFKDVHYFDNDGVPINPAQPNSAASARNFDGADWTNSVSNGAVTWTVTQTFATNSNANALRWGTLYNFRFKANVGPAANRGTATLGLFKPVANGVLAVSVDTTDVPGTIPCPACAADFDLDGGVNGGDIAAFFTDYEAGGICADLDNDGGITGADVSVFFTSFEAGGC